ncbi:Uncharacterized exonuclease domain-containing protein At3g15140 [Linum perenne]
MQTELGETGPVQDPVVGRIKRLASVISSDNNTLVADMRKAFNTIKDIAVELEKENQSTQVKELESVATQISESCDNCIRLTSAVNTVGDKYQPTTEYTDFKKLLDEEFKKLLNTPSQNDRLMRQFRESIWNVHHAGQPMPGEEQEDIIMTSTQSNLLNEKCPITGKMITELAEPVRSVDCKHIYEKEAVMAYIHRNSNKKCCVAVSSPETMSIPSGYCKFRTGDISLLRQRVLTGAISTFNSLRSARPKTLNPKLTALRPLCTQTYSSSPAPPPSPISDSLISGGGNGYRWKPMCLYYAQGKCNKMHDLDHLQVFNHDWSEEFRVLQLDLERKQPQMFDFLLVFDLEGKAEILEFPVILIDTRTMTVVDLFHRFVRPCSMSAERIDEYIANKYRKFGVDQVWHNTAIPFVEVAEQFEAWLIQHRLWGRTHSCRLHNAAFVTCGNWDVKTQVPHQCKVSKIQLPPYYNEWINLKDVFHNFYHPEEKAKGMRKMMEHLKMPMSGSHHLGIDDTRNIARIVLRMLSDGAPMPITGWRDPASHGTVKFLYTNRI